jgi:hypothetical protein
MDFILLAKVEIIQTLPVKSHHWRQVSAMKAAIVPVSLMENDVAIGLNRILLIESLR